MGLQSEGCEWKDKYHMMLLVCGILKRVQMNLSTKQSYRCRKHTYGYQGSMLVAQLCPTLQKDYSLPGFSVNGIFQRRTLGWVAIPLSRGSSQPRSPALQLDSLLSEPPGKYHGYQEVRNKFKIRIDIYTLLYVKQITNKDLYST